MSWKQSKAGSRPNPTDFQMVKLLQWSMEVSCAKKFQKYLLCINRILMKNRENCCAVTVGLFCVLFCFFSLSTSGQPDTLSKYPTPGALPREPAEDTLKILLPLFFLSALKYQKSQSTLFLKFSLISHTINMAVPFYKYHISRSVGNKYESQFPGKQQSYEAVTQR